MLLSTIAFSAIADLLSQLQRFPFRFDGKPLIAEAGLNQADVIQRDLFLRGIVQIAKYGESRGKVFERGLQVSQPQREHADLFQSLGLECRVLEFAPQRQGFTVVGDTAAALIVCRSYARQGFRLLPLIVCTFGRMAE